MKLCDWLDERPFALAMSSGFFSFYAHTGMLHSLTTAGFTPRSVAGSSAGALVGGAWAAGLPAQVLAERLVALRREEFWDPAPGAGLLAGRRFDRVLRAMLPVTAMTACRVPVAISAFDIAARRTAVLRDRDLVTAIRASCAVPGLFHPVWIDRRAYWDGGILDRAGLAGFRAPEVGTDDASGRPLWSRAGERVLFHHIAALSPWRRRLDLPRRPGMVTIVLEGLPRSGPFRLDAGRRAMELARDATLRALEQPVANDGSVRLSVH